MKKIYAAFGDFFSGGKIYAPVNQSQTSPVTITSFSQPHVLQSRMKEEKISHGGTVHANLSPVRLDMAHGAAVLYFCPMKTCEVLEVIAEGDGKTVPALAKIEGFEVPFDCKSGLYNLKNVELTSNGTIQVKATAETIWEYIEIPIPE